MGLLGSTAPGDRVRWDELLPGIEKPTATCPPIVKVCRELGEAWLPLAFSGLERPGHGEDDPGQREQAAVIDEETVLPSGFKLVLILP